MTNSENISKLIAIIAIITPLILIPGSDDYFYYPKILFVYTILMIIIGIHLLSSNRKKIKLDFMSNALIGYLILVVASTFTSIDPIRSIWGNFQREEGLITILAYLGIFIFAKTYYTFKPRHAKWMMITATIVALYGISQYFGFDPIPRDVIRIRWKDRAFSTMGNPNFLGTYLVLTLPVTIHQFLANKRNLYLAVSGILYLALLSTLTRSAWIGFLVIIVMNLYFVIKNKGMVKRFAILIILFTVITASMNEYSGGYIYNRFLSIQKDTKVLVSKSENFEHAGANRIFIWKRTLELIGIRPALGYGLETLDIAFVEKYKDDMLKAFNTVYIVDKAHNEYLHIAVSSGVPSMILYLVFITLCLSKGFRLTKLNSMYFPIFTAVLGYLVQAFFNISVVSVAYIFWLYLGIITNEEYEGNGCQPHDI